MAEARKLAFPLTFVGGRAQTVPVNSNADVQQKVEIILRTPLGTRLERPTFGVPDQTFVQGGAEAQPFIDAIDRDEPRARFTAAADGSDLQDMISRIVVTMQDSGQVTDT